MNGAQIAANQSVANLGLYWHVLGTGDFNADGHSDVLLRNVSGQVVLWTMNGNQIVSSNEVGNAGLGRVCRRCLPHDPAARYSTAAELADDLFNT